MSVLAVVRLPAALAGPIAEESGQAALTVTPSLSISSPVQYEPVILYYRITNNTATTIHVDFAPDDRPASLGLECFGPDGSRLEPVRSVDVRWGLVFIGPRISPSSWYDGTIVAQHIFNISRSSMYELHVNAQLPWAADDKSAGGTLAVPQAPPFQVGPADPARLSRIMDSLVDRLLSHTES